MSNTGLVICCFYWLGDRWRADGLGEDYVKALYRGVKRNLKTPFRFVCFTNEDILNDDSDGIEKRSFDMPSRMGVLPRLWQFNRNAGLFGNQVLSLDLDVIVIRDLTDIAGYRGEFCTRSKFDPKQTFKIDGDITSFIANEKNEARFWTPFINDPGRVESMTGGRERYWFRHCLNNNCDTWQNLFPGQVISYKRHVLGRGHGVIPPKTRIVSCHGNPRPHELSDKSVLKSIWRS